MVEATLGVGAAVTFTTAALLGYAGVLTWRRPAVGGARSAVRLFAVWWAGAALVLGLLGARTLLGALGWGEPAASPLLQYGVAAALASALAGLAYYLAYLLTGRPRLLAPILAAYALYFAFYADYIVRYGPWSLVVTPWDARLVPSVAPSAGARLFFGVLLAAPMLAMSVAYGSLFFRLREPTPRYRVGLVSGAFVVLFGAILLGYALGLDAKPWFPLFYQLSALGAAVLVLAAYRPPAWARARWGVQPVPSRGGPA